jgi:hypothetical protein
MQENDAYVDEDLESNKITDDDMKEMLQKWLARDEEENVIEEFLCSLDNFSHPLEETPSITMSQINQLIQIMEEIHYSQTEEQTEEELVSGSSCRKMEGRNVNWTVAQPPRRLPSRPSEEMDSEFFVTVATEDFKCPEPVSSEEVVFKAPVPFARKKLDLSIYTFDEPDDDHINEEASDELIKAADEDYKYGEEFAKKLNHMKRRPKLRTTKSKEERSLAKLTKKLSSSRNPLKRTHWNSGKRSRGRYRRKKVTLL